MTIFLGSYLTYRLQYTVLNDSVSSTGKIECGMPKCSELGPLFLALYITRLDLNI